MLDKDGFVAEANGVNVFLIKNNVIRTPFADACLPGITRATILSLCKTHDIPCEEARIALSEFYAADFVFTTGTMGELTMVSEIDGRTIRHQKGIELFEKIKQRLTRAIICHRVKFKAKVI